MNHQFVFSDDQLLEPLNADSAMAMTADQLGITQMAEICSTGVYIRSENGMTTLFPPSTGSEAYSLTLNTLAKKYHWNIEADKDFILNCIDKSFGFPNKRSIKARYARGEFNLCIPLDWQYPFLIQGISVWLRYREQGDSLENLINRIKTRMPDYLYLFNQDKFDVGLFCYLFMGNTVPDLPNDKKDFFCLIKGFPQFAQWDQQQIDRINQLVKLLNNQEITFDKMNDLINSEDVYLLERTGEK